MLRPALVGAVLLVAVSAALAQEQVTKEIPLWHQSAIEMAALFAAEAKPAPVPAPEPLEAVALRYAARTVADERHAAWRWQSCVEVSPAAGPPTAEPQTGGGLRKLLPGNLTPPVAVLWRNSLKVTGTADEIAKFREVIALLDKPAVRVGLEVHCLSLAPERAAKLPGVDWSWLQGDERDERLRCSFAHSEVSKLLADPEVNPAPLTTTLTLGNSRSATVTFIEAMPYYSRHEAAAPPALMTRVRVLRLELTPRRDADDSLTVLVWSQYLAARASGEKPDKLEQEGRWQDTREVQVRTAPGESALLRGVGDDGVVWASDGLELGSQRLLHPLVVVTPRPLPAEQAFLCDPGPLPEDTRASLVNTFFRKALQSNALGIMVGANEEGYTAVWYQTAPDQWEQACTLALYMLKPLVAALAGPAGTGDKYRRQDPTGADLDITVARQQIGAQPGIVLTWPKP